MPSSARANCIIISVSAATRPNFVALPAAYLSHGIVVPCDRISDMLPRICSVELHETLSSVCVLSPNPFSCPPPLMGHSSIYIAEKPLFNNSYHGGAVSSHAIQLSRYVRDNITTNGIAATKAGSHIISIA